MKKLLVSAVLVVATFAVLQGRGAAAGAEDSSASGRPKELTTAQMQADFDLMRHALEEAHPGLYRH